MTSPTFTTYIYFEPFGPRDYTAFRDEAAAYKYQQGLTAQRRASHAVTTRGNSYDEHKALLREFRAAYVARLAEQTAQVSA